MGVSAPGRGLTIIPPQTPVDEVSGVYSDEDNGGGEGEKNHQACNGDISS